ncbi:unnamed protein product [Cuscuta epithymum]|uniref:Uncharacterized protein n=1 Tax=Cuscuta epithymum TaxID=186058 RepID=A0AAV0G1C2_9ASTE|nr:unnamed protein product [Cuscuta epithymum]
MDPNDQGVETTSPMTPTTPNQPTPQQSTSATYEDLDHPIITSLLSHERKWTKEHPAEQITGDPSRGVCTRIAKVNECLLSCFLSQSKLFNVSEALVDPDWVIAMQDEVNQFQKK